MFFLIPRGRVSFEKIKKQLQCPQELFLSFPKFGYFMLEAFQSILVRHLLASFQTLDRPADHSSCEGRVTGFTTPVATNPEVRSRPHFEILNHVR